MRRNVDQQGERSLKLVVNSEHEVLISDELLHLFHLNDGLDGIWLGYGTSIGNRPIDYAKNESLWVYLD